MSTCFTNLRLRYDFHNSYPFVKKYLNLVSFILHASAHGIKACIVNGNCLKLSTNQNWTGSYKISTGNIFATVVYILKILAEFRKSHFNDPYWRNAYILSDERFYTWPSIFWRSMMDLKLTPVNSRICQ